MQILNYLLSENIEVLLPESIASTGKSADALSELNISENFSQYMDTELASVTSPLNTVKTEIIFPLNDIKGQILPPSDTSPEPVFPREILNTEKVVGYSVNSHKQHIESLENIVQADNSPLSGKELDKNLSARLSNISSDLLSVENIPESGLDETTYINTTPKTKNNIDVPITETRNFDIPSNPINKTDNKEISGFEKIIFDNSNNETSINSNELTLKNQFVKNTDEIQILDKNSGYLDKIHYMDITSRESSATHHHKENYIVKTDNTFAEQLSEKIDLLIKNNQKEAKISLDPENLGKIDVQIKMKNNEYVVNVLTQNEGAQQILEQHSAKLKQLFNDDNLTLNLSQQNNPDQPHARHNTASYRDQYSVQTDLTEPQDISAGELTENISYTVNHSVLAHNSVNLYI